MSNLVKTIGLVVVGLVLGTGTTFFMLSKATSSFVARALEAKAHAKEALAPEKPWDFWTVEMENLASELKDDKARLKQREDLIAQREARLQVEKQEIEKMRKQLETLRSTIDSRLIEVTAGEEANLKKLAKTYATLSPKAAMVIYKEMDDNMLAKLMSVMRPDAQKVILEELSRQSATDPNMAKRAAVVSEKLRLLTSTSGTP
jgi:Tfp pilus assembly protein PilN